MQRPNCAYTSSEQSTLEHPRSSSRVSPTTFFTMSSVVAALVASQMDGTADLEPIPPQSFSTIPIEYDEREQVKLHSGPFNIEGCEDPISFLDDGFTLMAGEDRLRMQNVQAYFSNLSLDKVSELLGDTGGVTEIECGQTLVMRSGDKRSLEIPVKDLIRIIETARNEQKDDIKIEGIPYKLQIETGWSTCLIPLSGNCTIDFQKLSKKASALIASGSH